ncbi:hypothetical protein EOT10_27870 [Streptomyces antnestii]|uniref:ATP-grasp domain-containing protein n=1 Tax=Streptomyces antnestii TaxID=2494256 RepID=A0A437PDY7_9ACTN|nr:peptide ligase PGM1-related protein [Streptomyces sp. San01]RVU20485.1 hypothetical protein EOT10_27870 [Streptomyces sp. San01]
MPKIILINVRADYPAAALGVTSSHPTTVSGWRHMWFIEEGDILVVPAQIEQDFLEYVGQVIGVDTDTILTLTRNEILNDEVILSPDFVGELQSLIFLTNRSEPWQFMPCFFTDGAAELSRLLGVKAGTGWEFASQRGPVLLNRKSHFRQLATGAGLPVPNGCITNNLRTLTRAVERLLPETGSVIIKGDNAAGGKGNIALTQHSIDEAFEGVRETRKIDITNVAEVAASVWDELKDQQVLVVESYHKARSIFYFEFHISDSREVRFIASGSARLEPNPSDQKELVWVGLDIPADLPPFSFGSAVTEAAKFAHLAADLGYQGYINIDAILTDSGELLFNESNARWGGGTILHAISERLVGTRYSDTHNVSSLRDVPPVPLPEALALLAEQEIAFDKSQGRGVIILACDPRLANMMECLIIGSSLDENRKIEGDLRKAVDEYLAAAATDR